MDDAWRTAITATRHCLTGCAIGEVLGMVLATWRGWHDAGSIAVSIALAFLFGYLLTFTGVRRAGLDVRAAVRTALAADTVSILVMEIVDNGFMLAVPGALDASLSDALFWVSLALGLAVAFVLTVPVNHWMIGRGRGHAVVHQMHEGQHHH
jgi:Zn-dependent protease